MKNRGRDFFPENKTSYKMATKGEAPPDDATKEFSAEKIRMKTAKAAMTGAASRWRGGVTR